jgi:hypothetical protein
MIALFRARSAGFALPVVKGSPDDTASSKTHGARTPSSIACPLHVAWMKMAMGSAITRDVWAICLFARPRRGDRAASKTFAQVRKG